jgi:hypothetical protein
MPGCDEGRTLTGEPATTTREHGPLDRTAVHAINIWRTDMLSKTLGICLLAIGAVLLLGGMAEAHYIQIGSRLVYHSVSCDVDLKNVPDPGAHPATGTCRLTITQADTLCRNNGGNFAPGQIPNLVVSAEAQILPADVSKKNGKGHISITVVPPCNTPTGGFPAEPGDPCLLGVTSADEGACPNAQNWDVVGVIVRQTAAYILISKCLDETCTLKIDVSESQSHCTLPSEVDFDTVIPPEGFEYACTLEFNRHLN